MAARSRLLASSRLLDMAAFLLLLVAVAVVTGTFSQERARGWARAGLALFAVSAGAGAIATMLVGALPDVANAWVDAPTGLKAGYVATFDAVNNVSGGIFAVAWAALAIFGLLYAGAMLAEGTFPRWLPWISVGSAVSTLTALALGVGLQLDIAFMLLVLGLFLSYLVIVAFGVRLWRSSRARRPTGQSPPSRFRTRQEIELDPLVRLPELVTAPTAPDADTPIKGEPVNRNPRTASDQARGPPSPDRSMTRPSRLKGHTQMRTLYKLTGLIAMSAGPAAPPGGATRGQPTGPRHLLEAPPAPPLHPRHQQCPALSRTGNSASVIERQSCQQQ